MNNTFETSLSVGLVMSLYDFNIPAEKTLCESDSTSLNCFTIQNQNDDNGIVYDHVWINGELSWRL
ncbi:hypothetical protein [Dyadobacter diqingensis]|uniref:hypothetical protein n=1 Tax=Dyadobacter diqingensis TaxID=2938121 RepID=UPI0020C1F0A3|nr:hypothetical protein [Dyadobacter diqingensis]